MDCWTALGVAGTAGYIMKIKTAKNTSIVTTGVFVTTQYTLTHVCTHSLHDLRQIKNTTISSFFYAIMD